MADYELIIYALLAAGAVAAALIVLYATRTAKAKRKTLSEPQILPTEAWRKRFALMPGRTVTVEEAQEAKENLKILDLEREILSFAIRRLYEAQAEGKISEEERERIAQRYKSRMLKVRDNLSKSESVVALHELESMQDDLIKLFSERFDDLGKKVEELRIRLEIKAEKEGTPGPEVISLPSAEEPEIETPEREKVKKRARRKPASAPAPRTEADKRIEEIRAEVEKVLERLGQIEVEGET